MGVLALLNHVLVAAVGSLLVPSSVLCLECAVGCRPRTPTRPRTDGEPDISAVVLIPAHDEELAIEDTLRGLVPELGAGQRVLVVADNCSDDTAALARGCGVDVLERDDPDRRGKGYALSYGIEHLKTEVNPPAAVVILDADCRIGAGSINRLCERAVATGRPVQADYLLVPPSSPTALARVSALAFLVRNRVRPLGLDRLGLPCHLTGSGMAFAWSTLIKAPPTRGNLVEDLQMGLDLAVLGHPPLYCPTATVESLLPARARDAAGQRRRWEHGQLQTLASQVPRLLRAGFAQRRLDLIALALDLCVPPLAMLVGLLCALTTASGLLAAVGGQGSLAFELGVVALVFVALGVLASWWGHGRQLLPARLAIFVPLYVLWKVPLYLAFAIRRRQTTWERTRRSGQDPDESSEQDP